MEIKRSGSQLSGKEPAVYFSATALNKFVVQQPQNTLFIIAKGPLGDEAIPHAIFKSDLG